MKNLIKLSSAVGLLIGAPLQAADVTAEEIKALIAHMRSFKK